MSDTQLVFALDHWQERLEITNYRIICERISPHQVCNEHHRRGQEFVGICTDHRTCQACLYHTRKLQTEDIVHELLHVKYPGWSEEQVNKETERLVMQKYAGREVERH